jgi:hypothetical protein
MGSEGWAVFMPNPRLPRLEIMIASSMSEEHARLIAAAPELRQACNDALFSILNPEYAKSPKAIAMLEDILTKALAKAKGE